jgi:hypothetical protein
MVGNVERTSNAPAGATCRWVTGDRWLAPTGYCPCGPAGPVLGGGHRGMAFDDLMAIDQEQTIGAPKVRGIVAGGANHRLWCRPTVMARAAGYATNHRFQREPPVFGIQYTNRPGGAADSRQ